MSRSVQKTIFISYHHPESQPYVLPAVTAHSQHLLIIIEKEIHAVIVEAPAIHERDVSAQRVIELYIQERASVVWHERREARSGFEQSVKVVIEEEGSFNKTFFFETTTNNVSHYSLLLVGPYAQVMLTGRVFLKEEGKQKITVEQLHYAPDTISQLEIHAVLDDQSALDYQGTITIEKDAVRSKAFQTQKNLIISPHARVTSVPNLQVLTHEVQCGHGSAVSHLNEDHLFYLQARGLTYEAARHCMVTGFLRGAFRE
jgi:Fe-S cluster assembly protein SufD